MGDRQELEDRLAERHGSILRFTRSILRDPAAAEDAAQETLLRAHRKLGTLDDPELLVAWLYRIATNVCRDRFRAAANRHRPLPLDAGLDEGVRHEPADHSQRLDKLFEQREMSACVQDFLTGLPDSYRAVILLHDEAGMTNPEIASALGVSVATIKIRLHRARKKLRAALSAACSFSTDERGVLVCERASGPHRS